MKRKMFNKRLVLNKTTVTHLNNNEMSNMKGGFLTVEYSKCAPCNDETWECETENGISSCPCWSDIWSCFC